jgi:hypothetical protein
MREFIWDENTCEFEEIFGMNEYPDGGNRVIVNMDGDLPRFKVEIDDFGCVMGALCRLVQRIVPTFQFPEVEKPRRTILRRSIHEIGG